MASSTSAAGATAPKTPPHSVNSASGVNSPLVVGSAAVSEHISTQGVGVNDVRPWITRNVDNYREYDADAMLQELLCGFEERLSSEKSRDVCDNDTSELVAKLYWPEERRQSEDEILQNVYAIASEEPTVKGHIPDMVWFHKFDETSTAKIRRSLGIQDPDAERGSRVLYIIMFRKLLPIMSLSGDEFLSAWWQVVLCHYTLWKHDVYHRDVSLGNLMVYWLNGQWIGVLNDYDLSSIERIGPSSEERTGTVPFVAIDLLDVISGKVPHLYRHDAESLVWVLVWVCLRYQGGKLLSNGRLLDAWLKVDANGCRKKKSAFMWRFRYGDADLEKLSPSHQSNWKIAVACLQIIFRAPQANMGENESILQTWLLDNVESVAPDIIVRHPVNVS